MSEFLTKDDFHDYVIDNRDRQDDNKKEIIDTLQTVMQDNKVDLEKDLNNLGGRVTKLEDSNTKQNRIGSVITALGGVLLGLLAFLK